MESLIGSIADEVWHSVNKKLISITKRAPGIHTDGRDSAYSYDMSAKQKYIISMG